MTKVLHLLDFVYFHLYRSSLFIKGFPQSTFVQGIQTDTLFFINAPVYKRFVGLRGVSQCCIQSDHFRTNLQDVFCLERVKQTGSQKVSITGSLEKVITTIDSRQLVSQREFIARGWKNRGPWLKYLLLIRYLVPHLTKPY